MSDTAIGDQPVLDERPTYIFRPSVMGRPHLFRLGEQALYYEIGMHSGSVSYLSITRLRLSFRPVSLATYRFIAEIWSPNAPKLTIASTSWRNFIEQRRQDAEYSAFVRELVGRIGKAGGTPSFETGTSPLIYWPGLALCAGLAIAGPWIVLRGLYAGSFGGTALVAVLFVLFGWQIFALFSRNRPGTFTPDAIPRAALPQG